MLSPEQQAAIRAQLEQLQRQIAILEDILWVSPRGVYCILTKVDVGASRGDIVLANLPLSRIRMLNAAATFSEPISIKLERLTAEPKGND